MNRLPIFFRWLIIAALADWLIDRTLTRTAIFMPKPPPVIAIYQVLTLVGQLAFTLTGLLAIAAAVWIAWQSWRTRRVIGLAFALPILIALSLVSLFVASVGWPAVGYHLLVVAMIGMLSGQVLSSEDNFTCGERSRTKRKIAWSVPALAVLAGETYQTLPALYVALRWPGPPPFTEALFNFGEMLALLTPVALWWAMRRTLRGALSRSATWAALPALIFAMAYLLNPAMTAIIAIWSTGLTLYLPWPLYAVSLWLASAVVIASLRRGGGLAPDWGYRGWALLLLAAGGYAPQLSTHVLLGIIALWLLTAEATASDFKAEVVSGLWRPAISNEEQAHGLHQTTRARGAGSGGFG